MAPSVASHFLLRPQFLLMVLLLVGACAEINVPPSKSIVAGMSKQSLTEAVGMPFKTERKGQLEAWRYVEIGMFVDRATTVWIENGKVVATTETSIGGLTSKAFRAIPVDWNLSPFPASAYSEVNPSSPTPTPATRKADVPPSGSSGTGFFVSKQGHIVTNEHVIRNCSAISVGDNAKQQVSVTLIDTDKRNDLALLKVSSTVLASAETKSLISKLSTSSTPVASVGLFRSEDVELGEQVLVAGFPYGEIFSDSIKVTGGMVSANRGIGDDTGQFQMDAAVQPGNSGGPIYDGSGNIVGVVVAQLNKLKMASAIGSLPENVNFGIKASTVRQFLTASGLPTKWSNRSKDMSTKDLAQIAKNQTVMVVCSP